jgi:hypothetical protein
MLTGEIRMKRLPKFLAAACLLLALSISAFAGDIGCPDAPPPPPPPPFEADLTVASVVGDAVTQSMLDILQNVLSLI